MSTKDGKLLVYVAVWENLANGFLRMAKPETPIEFVAAHQWNDEQLASRSDEIDAIVGGENNLDLIPDMRQLANLRAFISIGVGRSGLSPDMFPRGCAVAVTYGHEYSIAEWVIGAMLTLSRNVQLIHDGFSTQSFKGLSSVGGPMRDFGGSTVGLIGYGHIGRRVVELSRAFDAKVHVAMRTPISEGDLIEAGIERVYQMSDLAEMLSVCDFVVPAVAVNDDTEGMFGSAEFAAMKETTYFINVARAELVNEQALFDALKNKVISGAAIDVWWKEDLDSFNSDDPELQKFSDLPFWELDNVLMSPHYSAATFDTFARKFRLATENLDRLNRGEPLINVVPELSN